MSPSSSLDSRTVSANRFCEFLVVATHAILFLNGVYPDRMFEGRRKYGIATHYSKHPALNAYITRTIGALRPWVLAGTLTSVTIPVFSNETGIVHARYVFDSAVLPPHRESVDAAALAALDAQLRAHLLRLLSTAVPEHPPREELQFDFIVRTEGVRVGSEWVPADHDERKEIAEAEVVPLKDCDQLSSTVQLSSRVEFPVVRT